MRTEKLFPIDPTNIKQIKLLSEFQKQNGIYTPIGFYNKDDLTRNDIELELVLQKNAKVEDLCHLQGYRDIKSCTLSFAPKKKKKRKIVTMATNYAIETLGMEEVYLKINPEDENMIDYLNTSNFECLGDEKGSIIFLKEKEQ